MKTKSVSAFILAVLLSAAAHAQDTTSMSKRELRRQARAQKVENTKTDLKEAGQDAKETAKKVGQDVGEAATETGKKVKKGAVKAGTIINTETDKVIEGADRETDKLKARRDSLRAAKRDSL